MLERRFPVASGLAFEFGFRSFSFSSRKSKAKVGAKASIINQEKASKLKQKQAKESESKQQQAKANKSSQKQSQATTGANNKQKYKPSKIQKRSNHLCNVIKYLKYIFKLNMLPKKLILNYS